MFFVIHFLCFKVYVYLLNVFEVYVALQYFTTDVLYINASYSKYLCVNARLYHSSVFSFLSSSLYECLHQDWDTIRRWLLTKIRHPNMALSEMNL